jgi:rod shape-determining protein MreB
MGSKNNMPIKNFLRKIFGYPGDLAVDLGTANTLVWHSKKGLIINEPSVVAIMELKGGIKKVIAVGNEAKRMVGRTPEDIKAIRPLRDGVIADFDVAEAMLSYFIRKALEGGNKFLKPRVVIGVPSIITPVERRAVIEAAELAGAGEVYLVYEPMAAAIGAGLKVDQPGGNMIVDIGGGTTEVAVISMAGIVCSTSLKIAGDELDEAIIHYVRRTHGIHIGERTAEQLKIEIGAAIEIEPEKGMEVYGRDVSNGIPKKAWITQRDIVNACREQVYAIISAIKNTLEKTPPELSADIYERGIYLAGGGALLRGLDTLIEKETGVKAIVTPEPLLAVTKGCAKVLEDIELLTRVNVS